LLEELGLRRVAIASLFVSLIFLSASFVSVFALPLFYDDFSSGALDNWEVLRGDWSIVDGEFAKTFWLILTFLAKLPLKV